jgi:hypothetical protein
MIGLPQEAQFNLADRIETEPEQLTTSGAWTPGLEIIPR